MTRLTLIALAFALIGCGGLLRQSNYYSVRPDGTRSEIYSRVNEYEAYGKDGLGTQAAIAAAYETAEHAPPPSVEVEIYNSSLPPGVRATGAGFEIEAGAAYEAVGKFELGYWLASAPQETEVKPDLQRLAAVTHGDVIVVQVQRVAHGDPRVNYLVGLVLRKRAPGAVAAAPPPPVAAARPRARVHATLDYQAPANGCLSAAEFADEVSARLGYSPWSAGAGVALRARIAAKGAGFHATISGARGEPKELAGATCRSVTDAAVAVLAVQLDESL